MLCYCFVNHQVSCFDDPGGDELTKFCQARYNNKIKRLSGGNALAVTIKDIARHTGLGLATISKYLNGGNVLEKNRIKIDQAIKELDYHVNEFGRSLKTGHSGTIGVVIPELSIQFSACIISAMEDVLRQHNLGVIVCDCRTDVQREADAISFLLGKRVDGMINMPVCHSKKNLQPAIDRGIPIVLIDRVVSDCKLDAVLIDNIGAAQKACEYFIVIPQSQLSFLPFVVPVFAPTSKLSILHTLAVPLAPSTGCFNNVFIIYACCSVITLSVFCSAFITTFPAESSTLV